MLITQLFVRKLVRLVVDNWIIMQLIFCQPSQLGLWHPAVLLNTNSGLRNIDYPGGCAVRQRGCADRQTLEIPFSRSWSNYLLFCYRDRKCACPENRQDITAIKNAAYGHDAVFSHAHEIFLRRNHGLNPDEHSAFCFCADVMAYDLLAFHKNEAPAEWDSVHVTAWFMTCFIFFDNRFEDRNPLFHYTVNRMIVPQSRVSQMFLPTKHSLMYAWIFLPSIDIFSPVPQIFLKASASYFSRSR